MLGFRPVVDLDGTPTGYRKALEVCCAYCDTLSLMDDFKNEVTARDGFINAAGRHRIPVRVYHSTKASNTPAPVAFFYHGGGLVLGSVAAGDLLCWKLALDFNHVLVIVEYMLGETRHFGMSSLGADT
ncbi:hypothetical protein BJ878DRAFT_167884 [Calycina marina]|uniref:Alpha/beta hydrolase fold-3 domain-containing protein n=1 Tax=Calycina marina TaxID=1763456 RepID=A0A9P7YZY3_9HELO|nr:hypothetical protein BJ878DRAFT_167884 [Calycina marina]